VLAVHHPFDALHVYHLCGFPSYATAIFPLLKLVQLEPRLVLRRATNGTHIFFSQGHKQTRAAKRVAALGKFDINVNLEADRALKFLAFPRSHSIFLFFLLLLG
jgi:hypothetical protein